MSLSFANWEISMYFSLAKPFWLKLNFNLICWKNVFLVNYSSLQVIDLSSKTYILSEKLTNFFGTCEILYTSKSQFRRIKVTAWTANSFTNSELTLCTQDNHLKAMNHEYIKTSVCGHFNISHHHSFPLKLLNRKIRLKMIHCIIFKLH